MGMGKGYG